MGDWWNPCAPGLVWKTKAACSRLFRSGRYLLPQRWITLSSKPVPNSLGIIPQNSQRRFMYIRKKKFMTAPCLVRYGKSVAPQMRKMSCSSHFRTQITMHCLHNRIKTSGSPHFVSKNRVFRAIVAEREKSAENLIKNRVFLPWKIAISSSKNGKLNLYKLHKK